MVNNCLSIIAQVLSNSVINSFWFCNHYTVAIVLIIGIEITASLHYNIKGLLNSISKSFISFFRKVTPNLEASFVLFKIVLPSISFITSCVTLTTHETAWILKFSAPSILTSPVVIIARYDAILDQSEHADFYNHLSNYTN